MRIAVIGTGISGSLAARLLSTQHQVTVFEANGYAGGHANTVNVSAFNSEFVVDTGFMVFNRTTYPNFCKLLEILAIESQPSDMSFSVHCDATGLEYQGSSLNGIYAQRLNLLRPSFHAMLRDILRFNRQATAAAADGKLPGELTVGEFLQTGRYGKRFVQQYLLPMAAAIWSTRPQSVLEFPAKFMLGFFANHGLMQLRDRPQWRTIVGGSRKYVSALLAPLADRVRLNAAVASVDRVERGVMISPVDGVPELFDHVVLATHANQTLELLWDPTPNERRILSSFPYQPNEAVLHTDLSFLPRKKRACASWNYRIGADESAAASVTYDLSRLQRVSSPSPILLSLNPSTPIDPAKVLRTFTYHHPAYTTQSLAAQRRFHEINGQHRTSFCGAYWGYGFHEDGVNSALAVAKQFGIGLEACKVASMKEPLPTPAINQ